MPAATNFGMTTTLAPQSVAELAEAVRATPRLLAVGAQTKPRLSAVDCVKLSTAKLSGIVEYEPSEFTFTALAGTPVRDIAAALAERGQYLPFDPMLVDAGATLGGTVAAGVSGPGRFRFGGLRDFILGVQFVDGAGRVLRLGGKVVKNAAGFDVPKFFVGSLGRFGVLTEITFKVFPQPASRFTLLLDAGNAESVAKIFAAAGSSRWELDALDWLPDGKFVAMRLGGPVAALETLSQEILARWPGKKLTAAEADELWAGLREFDWVCVRPHPGPLPSTLRSAATEDGQEREKQSSPLDARSSRREEAHSNLNESSQSFLTSADTIIKVALTPGNVVAFTQTISTLSGARAHVSAGGNVAFVSLVTAEQAAQLDQALQAQKLSGVTLRGDAPLWLGARYDFKISTAVKSALDAENRFPSLND